MSSANINNLILKYIKYAIMTHLSQKVKNERQCRNSKRNMSHREHKNEKIICVCKIFISELIKRCQKKKKKLSLTKLVLKMFSL